MSSRESRLEFRRSISPMLLAVIILLAPGVLPAQPAGTDNSAPLSRKNPTALLQLNAPHARVFKPLVARKIRGAVAPLSPSEPDSPSTTPELEVQEIDSGLSGRETAFDQHDTFLGETPVHTLGGSVPRTPALTTGPLDLFANGIDPNIAASASYLVTTTGGRIHFYSKSGQLLLTDRKGDPFDASQRARQLFAPLFQGPGNVNEGLNLPAGLQCDPSVYVFDPNLTATQKASVSSCLNSVYDSRVLFDTYRKRFWIVASARNGSDSSFAELPIIEQRVGRRDRMLLAVSSTEDPREDWYLYVLPSTVDLGKCNDIGEPPGPPSPCPGSIYRPGESADYPNIGIGKDWVVVTIGVGSPNPHNSSDPGRHHQWTSMNVLDAAKLASGGCAAACGWNFGPVDLMGYPGSRLRGVVAPVKQRGVSDPAWNLLAQTVGGDTPRLLILALKGTPGKKPGLTGAFVPIAGFASPTDIPQPKGQGAPTPVRIAISNLRSASMHAVARGRKLFTVFQDCRKWTADQSECSGALRLVGVDFVRVLGNPTVSTPPFVDRRFGRRNVLDDPKDALVWYGSPAVEVNGDGDVIVVYNRGGTKHFLEASYTALIHGERDIRPSSRLRIGESVLTDSTDPTKDPCCHMDTGGIAADPGDDKGIWMLQAYAGDAGSVAFALGKVFGTQRVDLSVWTGKGIRLPPGGLSTAGKTKVTVRVENGGDAGYPGDPKGQGRGTVSLKLVQPGAHVRVAKFEIPKLDAGAGADVEVAVVAVPAPPPGAGRVYSIEVKVDPTVSEYSTKNNSGSRLVRVAR
ncbi:MAG: hypothetical protein ABIW85_02610 [Variovorax sp.]